MYHFVQYLDHFIFTLLWYYLQIILYSFSDFQMYWKNMQWNLFFWNLVSLRRGGSCMWVWGKLFMCVYFTFYNTKSSKSTVFFPCNINLHRAMLSKYLGTYSSALCQIWALEKAFEERNKCQSYPKSWVLGCMHLIGQNKQSTFRQCTVYLPCNKDLHVQSNAAKLVGDIFLSFVPNLSIRKGIWGEKRAKAILKARFLMHAFD